MKFSFFFSAVVAGGWPVFRILYVCSDIMERLIGYHGETNWYTLLMLMVQVYIVFFFQIMSFQLCILSLYCFCWLIDIFFFSAFVKLCVFAQSVQSPTLLFLWSFWKGKLVGHLKTPILLVTLLAKTQWPKEWVCKNPSKHTLQIIFAVSMSSISYSRCAGPVFNISLSGILV